MKLNPDCIRDILLAIEAAEPQENTLVETPMYLITFIENDFTSKYDKSDIAYTLIKLEEAGLINSSHRRYDGGENISFLVSSLTFYGHEYLEKIRKEENWKTIKSIGSKVGDFSLSAIGKIAEGVTSAAIDKLIGNYLQSPNQ